MNEHDDSHDDDTVAALRQQLAAAQRQLELLHRAQQRRRSPSWELDHLRRERDTYRREVADVRNSTTWRVGRAALFPVRAVRAVRSGAVSLRGRAIGSALGRRLESLAGVRPVLDHAAAEDVELRTAYEAAVSKQTFSDPEATKVVMAVYTTDLSEGRGDIYTAVGLGRFLERRGYEVVYLPRSRWYELPDGTDVYVAMIAEEKASVDPLRVEGACLRVAWIRNATQRWLATPNFDLYDVVMCSSERSAREVRRTYTGEVGILRIGVDHELFAEDDPSTQRRGVVSTANQWGGERELFAMLRSRPITFPLRLYGEHRGLHGELAHFTGGKISFFSLPSLYRMTQLVLDDQQNVSRGYGNINSRVYESLACGALPVSNATLGLLEAELDALPSFATAAQLHEQLQRLLSDDDERRRLAGRLQRTVLASHTYERRAEEFDALVGRGLTDQRVPTEPGRTILGFMPDYRATNPYQTMLYSRLDDSGALVLPMNDPEAMLHAPTVPHGAMVFHLHWTATILGPCQTEETARRRAAAFLDALSALQARRGKVIWTVHNVLPHECQFPETEIELRRGIAARADVIHVMTERTVEATRPHFELPAERIRVIPHGSYVDVYPNVVSQGQARDDLGLGRDELVFLFLGGIRPYKGVDDLLDAFDTVARERPHSRLIVAGRPGRWPGRDALEQRCRRHPQVLSSFEEVPDLDLQRYYNACDVVVLPYRQVLNSGAVLLAYSFGRPVIARGQGALLDAVTDDVGRLFDDTEGLVRAMLAADELRDDRYRQAAYDRARAYDYVAMADDFAALLAALTTGRAVAAG